MSVTRHRRIAGATASVAWLAFLLAACGPRANPVATPQLTEAEKAGYLSAPDILSVSAGSGGAPLVRGQARPSTRIRATLPSGEAYGATADSQGRFEMELPGDGGPVMVAFAAEDVGRATPAEGWLFAPAGDYGHAALLRAGTSSKPLAANPAMIAIIDFDAAGGASVSGRVQPRAEVRATLDGVVVGEAKADDQGRYVLRLSPPAGVHSLRLAAGSQNQERMVNFTAAATPPGGSFAALRVADGWRVDWKPPGGGVQTTYIFSRSGAS